MKRIFTLTICMLFFAATNVSAQGNWVVADQSVSPSSPINSCLKASVAGSYTWLSFNTFINNNHLAQLAYALPPAFDISSGIPSITDNSGNPIPGLVPIFTPNSGGVTVSFAPGTTFAPGFKFILRIDSLEIMDNQSYTNQQATHSISFVAAPGGESFNDNIATVVFGTTQCSTPLSVNQLSLNATLVKGNGYKAQLAWTADADAKFKSFVIEKSRDAANWTILTETDAKLGNGLVDYQAFDNQLRSGVTHYRVAGISADGKYNFSKISSVHWQAGTGSGVSLYPNPTKDLLNVDFLAKENASIEIKVHDLSGRTVKSVSSKSSNGMNNVQINLSDLSDGVYSVELFNNSRLVHIEKINKLD